MKKLKIMIINLIMILLVCTPIVTAFGDTSYYTVTEGPNNRTVGTQTAYEAQEMINPDVSNPEDIFIDKPTGDIYIADTGNSRITVISPEGKLLKTIGNDILQSPTGVYVDMKENVYVADYVQGRIFVFDSTGKKLKEIGKPKEPIYGVNKDFVPKKVAVDRRGNIYAICEGSTNGVVMLSSEGNFLGYTGSNKTNVSLKMIAQRMTFTAGQKGQLLKIAPPSPTNIAIDDEGLIYTVTNGITDNPIKKFNIVGINILNSLNVASSSLVDLDVDSNGFIYAINQYGTIFQYDSFGNLLFAFGGSDSAGERMGLIRNPAGLALSSDGSIYTLDKEKNIIFKFTPTEFAQKVMQGDNLYRDGLYLDSEGVWQDIFKMNSSFILCYKALAKADFKKGNYSEALKNFKLGEDTVGYSDAFWEIRNQWLQNNASFIILLLIALYIFTRLVKYLDKRKHVFDKLKLRIKKIQEIKLVSELLYCTKFLKHPIDSYYELKRNNKVSVLSSTILYLWLFILQILGVYIVNFIFNPVNPDSINLTAVFLQTFVPILLWIIANYLVSAINDGEGTLKDIYRGTIYALSPYLIFALPVMLLSNVLTLNESFMYSYSMFFLKGWCVFLLILMVMQVHNYTLKETIRSILTTIFAMLMIILLVFIIVVLFTQEMDFVNSIWRELKYRV